MTPVREQTLAVVGGGAGSFGRVIVERLAAASMRVVALDFDSDRIATARTQTDADGVEWKVVDICDGDAVHGAYEEVSGLGVPAVLVNSAGQGWVPRTSLAIELGRSVSPLTAWLRGKCAQR
jgi:NADP-dependent 3-hydroxy acid dehydrogenase YdfG